jgi:hypothetical protein
MAKRNTGTTIKVSGPGCAEVLAMLTRPKDNVVLSREDAQLIQRALSSAPATGDIVQAVCAIDKALA